MATLIKAEGIKKEFGEGSERRAVLEGVSVEIGEGEFVAVMGPSGSGKTTLLYALSGIDGVDGGTVEFAGKRLDAMRERDLADLRRKRIGFVFQQPTLLKVLGVLDNVMLPAMRDNPSGAAALEAKARALMERMGIGELGNRAVGRASGGQLQRAGICRALMNDPSIVFGDEPTGALNSATAREIMDILTAINAEGTAVLLVTHDASVAARADRVLFMRDGGIRDELRMPKYDAARGMERLAAVSERMGASGI